MKLFLCCFLAFSAWLSTAALLNAADLRSWDYQAADINGNPITIDTFLNKVTVVTFSTKESRGKAMRLGQEIGQEFGHRASYQSLAIPNTSNVPFWAKFIAHRKVAGFQKKAVAEALKRQEARGNLVSKDEIRKKVIFVHDTDGRIWEHLGVNRESISNYVGVIDKSGKLVFIAEIPVNKDDLFQRLEEEFRK